MASENGEHSLIVQTLLENHDTTDIRKPVREQPFYHAAKNDQADDLDVLLQCGNCDFEMLSFNGTPLHVAVSERNIKVVEVILKHICRISKNLTNDEQRFRKSDTNLVKARGNTPPPQLSS